MTYHLQWLIEKYEQGEKLKYIFFWGHQPSADGRITESCFSQWWESVFEVDGTQYLTAEHWMMAEKARLFDDRGVLAKILQAKTPAEAKKLGRLVRDFDAKVWDSHKFEIVVQGNLHKFSQNDVLKVFLLQTQERILVEASPLDEIWGIGMGKNNENAQNPKLWRGENLLGFALMEVRDILTNENS